MTGYEAFEIYHTLKLHFTTASYDYFKYGGKSKISIQAFENRKDKYQFYKLSRKYSTEEYKQFLISTFLTNEKAWAGTLLEDDAYENHLKRMATIQSLTYIFKNDCSKITEYGKINNLLKTSGEHPDLLTMALQRIITFETLCILNSMMNFASMWNRRIEDTIRWPGVYMKIIKYAPFLEYDRENYPKIALKELT